jgi:biotin carboxyl carrier protein
VQSARAQRAELLAGASDSDRNISNENVELRRTALLRTKNDEALKVEAALRLLYSDDATAYSKKAGEDASAPVISGSYLCNNPGTYTLNVYSSDAASGYSVRFSGLESGTFTASTDQDISLGRCGLRARFSPNTSYHNTTWYIDIPNTASPTYTSNKNAYDLALANEKSAVSTAQRALAVAEAETAGVEAPARDEAVVQASAALTQAEARLQRAQATYKDSTLYAPFAGTVVDLTAITGEAVTTAPVITLVSPDNFELTARVPEIDIGKLQVGQKAEVVFDTSADTTLHATIDYIAPSAILIDGVAYYEARPTLSSTPPWLRSGLNADVDIIVNETTALRLPKRFITETNGVYTVLVPTSDRTYATTTIDVTLIGNDGYTAIVGLENGTKVIAPE